MSMKRTTPQRLYREIWTQTIKKFPQITTCGTAELSYKNASAGQRYAWRLIAAEVNKGRK